MKPEIKLLLEKIEQAKADFVARRDDRKRWMGTHRPKFRLIKGGK